QVRILAVENCAEGAFGKRGEHLGTRPKASRTRDVEGLCDALADGQVRCNDEHPALRNPEWEGGDDAGLPTAHWDLKNDRGPLRQKMFSHGPMCLALRIPEPVVFLDVGEGRAKKVRLGGSWHLGPPILKAEWL